MIVVNHFHAYKNEYREEIRIFQCKECDAYTIRRKDTMEEDEDQEEIVTFVNKNHRRQINYNLSGWNSVAYWTEYDRHRWG